MVKLKIKSKASEAQKERGREILFSLKILVNIIFALLIFQTFLILPRPEDPEFEYYTLKQIFEGNSNKLMVIVVGFILTMIYWVQINKQLGNLRRSSSVHAVIAVFQMASLMLYLYFVRFDLEFDGLTIALRMQSVFLALAGFLGVFNWIYARSHNMMSDQISDQEETRMLFQFLPEPITALISLPFASVSPMAWTLSFLLIIPITMILNRVSKKYENNS